MEKLKSITLTLLNGDQIVLDAELIKEFRIDLLRASGRGEWLLLAPGSRDNRGNEAAGVSSEIAT